VIDFYTFLITSSLNTNTGIYSIEQRLSQTIDTIFSIRKHVKNACIVFIDTELPPLNSLQKKIIVSLVDHYIDYVPGIFEKVLDKQFAATLKTVGEYCLYDRAFDYIIKNNLVGKRIFKISGRYRLCDTFDISVYENPVFDGKYVFRHKIMYMLDLHGNVIPKDFLESRLWSLCYSRLLEFHTRLPEFLLHTVNNIHGIELAFWELLDKTQLFIIPQIHVEGNLATNGEYIVD
jgi:hypothetical protein